MRSKKAVMNIVFSLLLQIITIFCSFILPKLIISAYGSNVNGLVASITQFLAFITLLESGFGPVIKSMLYKPIANKNKDEIARILKASERIFRVISFIFILYICILCIVLPIKLIQEFNWTFTFSLIIIIAISIFAEYFFGMTYRLYLQAKQKTYVIAIIQISTLILNVISVLILIYLNQSIQVVKLVSSLIFVLRPILLNLYVKKKYDINLKNIDNTYKIENKWDGLAQHVAYVVHTNADIAILTICTDLIQVSIYSVYLMIINGVKYIVEACTGGIDAAFGDMIAKEEHENMNKNFKIYEGFYFTISTIAFLSTIFLIIPFVKLYTRGITDANYINPLFAYIMVIAEFICMIRQPYNDLVKVVGHFKQTRIGAWIEVITNILVSFILVWKYGIVGVALGTLVAMLIRTVEFMYYTSKYILKRNIWFSYRNLFIIIIEMLMITLIMNVIPNLEINNYKQWILSAIFVCVIASIVTLLINGFVYKDSFNNVLRKLK